MPGPGGHNAALEDSWGKLTAIDPRTLATNANATMKPEAATLLLKVMDEDCAVNLSDRTIECTSRLPGGPNDHLQILILHYLLGAGNAQVANRLATYREFEGGALYYQAFKGRTIDRLVREFGERADLLKHVGDAVHAEPVKMGSVAFRVNFFPKLPITIVLWLGDEEVPASANLLFDANAGQMLATEDLSVLGGELVSRLIELAKA